MCTYKHATRWVLAVVIPLAGSVPIARAEDSAGVPPPEAVAKRVREIREEFARRPQSHSDLATKTTVQALIAIVQEESQPDGLSATGHTALRELGSFLDSQRAVEFLVSRIDLEPAHHVKAAPLSHYHWSAAKSLLKGGPPVRREILGVLSEPQPDYKLYLMAYILVSLDATGNDRETGLPIAIYRLTRELERMQPSLDGATVRGPDVQERIRVKTKNLQRMVAMLMEPNFFIMEIPGAPTIGEKRDKGSK